MVISDIEFEVYIEEFLKHIPLGRRVDASTCVGRCIMCGDSKKNKQKTRLYLLRETGNKPSMVTCHNCGVSKTASKFFEEFLPQVHKELSKGWADRDLSLIKNKIGNEQRFKYKKIKEPSAFEKLKMYKQDLNKSKVKVKMFLDKYTQPIFNISEAVDYMRSRNIPEEYISNMRVMREEFCNPKTFRYSYYRDYIIIPFLDKDGSVYFFQSRKFRNFENTMCKYLMCHIKPDNVYTNYYMNEERVDPNKKVVIVEGTLDSFHVHNSISVNGIKKITDESIEHFENRFGKDNLIFAVDNEMIDKDSEEKIKFLLERHKRVFLWRLMYNVNRNIVNIKDFNDLCRMSQRQYIPLEVINKYSTNNLSTLLE
jgi:hypothetical protein